MRKIAVLFVSAVALMIYSSSGLWSQNTGRRAAPVLHDAIDENQLTTLAGNTRPEAVAENDMGAVSSDFRMDHLLLQLKRSPQQEQAIAQFIAELHNPQSPNFHKWLTAEQFGKEFGLAESDVQTVRAWLQSHGFTVNYVYPNGMLMDFSGDAGQVARAFHTSIHNLSVNGVHHIANMSDPQIPSALAPAVAGVVSLHDFRPRPMIKPKYSFSSEGQPVQALVPADVATIYDFNPLYAAGITGEGEIIAVMEDSDMYSTADWTTFRTTFGLTKYKTGTLSVEHPGELSGAANCADPGVIGGTDGEVALDAEYSSASAPGAAIVVASCADTITTFGGFIAMQNMINSDAPPSVVSISYGECEPINGASANAYILALYQQAVTEGISVFVSSGDEGAASCDANGTTASHGISVSAFASTPYNVAVGGTDFSDLYNGTVNNYWSSTNSATYGSALSYIPEIPWNGSCASTLVASYSGYSVTYGTDGFCNSSTARSEGWIEVVGGSGGPSGCFTGAPLATAGAFGTVSGSCQGVPKPAWQTGLPGIPNDGVRDIPDVSLFASNGIWGHYYVFCWSDVEEGGARCTGAPSGWAAAGGTSFSSPIMAGLQALVNQHMGGLQGNPNYVYYPLAATSPAIFHSVTQGDIDMNCSGTVNCYGVVGTIGYGRGGRPAGTTWGGALSVSSSSFTIAYPAAASWNFANGIGSVDAYQLVMNWSSNP